MQEYLGKARGPTKLKVLVEHTNKLNPKIFTRLEQDLTSKYKDELDEMMKK
jgi:hypothetical protein